MKHLLLAGVALATAAAPAAARQLTIDDVTMLSRIGAPTASKDGHWLVWAQRETDLAADKGRYDLWRLDLTKRGARPEPLAAEPDVNENDPQIVGDTVYFTSDRKAEGGGGGDGAVWAMPVAGGAARKVTGFPGGLGGFKVSPDATKLLVWADRRPGAPSLTPALEKKDSNAGAGRTYDQLFVRHWDSWADGTRSQLFVLPLTRRGRPATATASRSSTA